MIDYENLSKYKKLYVMHKTEDDQKIVCEKFPIVYINRDLVYYKPYGTMYLESINTRVVHESLIELFTSRSKEDVIRLLHTGYKFFSFSPIGHDMYEAELIDETNKISQYQYISQRVHSLRQSVIGLESRVQSAKNNLADAEKRLEEVRKNLLQELANYEKFCNENNFEMKELGNE